MDDLLTVTGPDGNLIADTLDDAEAWACAWAYALHTGAQYVVHTTEGQVRRYACTDAVVEMGCISCAVAPGVPCRAAEGATHLPRVDEYQRRLSLGLPTDLDVAGRPALGAPMAMADSTEAWVLGKTAHGLRTDMPHRVGRAAEARLLRRGLIQHDTWADGCGGTVPVLLLAACEITEED